MNSPICWIGGKKLLRKQIIAMFPEKIDRYIEVFGGAGWVLFGRDKHAPLEVYNDAESNLVNLFRCIKYHCGELQRELEWRLNSREDFYSFKAQLSSPGLTDVHSGAIQKISEMLWSSFPLYQKGSMEWLSSIRILKIL